MHPALEIHEIRGQIFENFAIGMEPVLINNRRTITEVQENRIRRATLASLANTSHTFSDDALEVLWRSMDRLKPLYSLIPGYKMLMKNDPEGPLQAEDITPSCCHRFILYSKRIRCLLIDSSEDVLLTSSQYRSIIAGLYPEQTHLFPSLQILYIHTFRLSNYDFIPFHGPPSLLVRLILSAEEQLWLSPELSMHFTATRKLERLIYDPMYVDEDPVAREGQHLSKLIAASPFLTHLSVDYLHNIDQIDSALAIQRSPLKVLRCSDYEISKMATIMGTVSESIEWLEVWRSVTDGDSLPDNIYLPSSGFPHLEKIKFDLDKGGTSLLKALLSRPLHSLNSLALGLGRTFHDNLWSVATVLRAAGSKRNPLASQITHLTFKDTNKFLHADEEVVVLLQQLLDTCPNLKSLTLCFYRIFDQEPISRTSHPNIVELYLFYDYYIFDWWSALTRERFPRLKYIVVHPKMEWVDDTCNFFRKREIKVKVWDSNLALQELETDRTGGYDRLKW